MFYLIFYFKVKFQYRRYDVFYYGCTAINIFNVLKMKYLLYLIKVKYSNCFKAVDRCSC